MAGMVEKYGFDAWSCRSRASSLIHPGSFVRANLNTNKEIWPIHPGCSMRAKVNPNKKNPKPYEENLALLYEENLALLVESCLIM